MIKEYMTEALLGQFIREHIADSPDDVIYNKRVPKSHFAWRPDYRIEEKKLLVEFDGYRHYSDPRVCFMDYMKDCEHKDIGYTVIRLPYFIQLDQEAAEWLFEGFFNTKDFVGFNTYPHGFIDDKAMLPGYFCQAGVNAFQKTLNDSPDKVHDAIMDSLQNRCEEETDKYGFDADVWVYPTHMWNDNHEEIQEVTEMRAISDYEFVVPPGEYILGDPCYSIPDEDWDVLVPALVEKDGTIIPYKGKHILKFNTMWGDGIFDTSLDFTLSADAGNIGLIPIDAVDKRGKFTAIVKFDTSVSCSKSDSGVLTFGRIQVFTDNISRR